MYEGNLAINIEYNVWFKVKCLEISENGLTKSSSGLVRENLKIWHLNLEIKQNILRMFKA